ncbi:MAG: hypothetical protein IJN50_03980 [Clostridia bacterium]|nr:hypothetical protein [Clostridia bacterium]
MENIAEVFKDKNFDEITLKYINNFIEEFDDLFGKYVNREEVIKRIKENLNQSFVFKEIKGAKGLYYNKEKKIVLSNKIIDEEELKDVIFHEMIHCITAREKYTGFSKSYTSDDYEELIVTCKGVTEGFTQLVTQIRNAKYYSRGSDNAYPILTEQIANLANLIGMEKFLNAGFNEPEKLFDIMKEAGLIDDEEIELQVFLDNFDVIWKYEKDIHNARGETSESRLIEAIFGHKKDQTEHCVSAKEHIIKTFLTVLRKNEVETINEVEEIYRKNNEYAKQLAADEDYNSYEVVWEKIDELISKGMSREEILSGASEDFRKIISERFYMMDFFKLNPQERLIKLNNNVDLYDFISDNRFSQFYKDQIVNDFFGYEIENKDYLFEDLVWGLADKIIERNYDIGKLSIEFINFKKLSGITYNLYESDGIDTKYLDTYSTASISCQFSEFRIISSDEERTQILDRYTTIPENAILFIDDNGCILTYLGENQYTYINEENEEYSNNGEVEYNFNKIEILHKQLEARLSRYKVFEEMRI